MSDLIKRQDAIEAIADLESSVSVCSCFAESIGMKRMQGNAVSAIVSLPSAEPNPDDDLGVWEDIEIIESTDDTISQWQSARCSKCGLYHTTPYMYYYSHYDYCPSCGKKMRKDIRRWKT